jgi:hypothetical protein
LAVNDKGTIKKLWKNKNYCKKLVEFKDKKQYEFCGNFNIEHVYVKKEIHLEYFNNLTESFKTSFENFQEKDMTQSEMNYLVGGTSLMRNDKHINTLIPYKEVTVGDYWKRDIYNNSRHMISYKTSDFKNDINDKQFNIQINKSKLDYESLDEQLRKMIDLSNDNFHKNMIEKYRHNEESLEETTTKRSEDEKKTNRTTINS